MATKSKTTKIESTGKAQSKTGSKASKTAQPVSSKTAKTSSAPTCSICGKPLTDPESIEAGIGPECQNRLTTGGWTVEKIAEQREALTVENLPKGYLPLSQVEDAAVEMGIPRSRVLRAAGGNRGLGEPKYPEFALLFYQGKRYLPPSVLKALPKIAGETKRTPPVPKGGKVAKAGSKTAGKPEKSGKPSKSGKVLEYEGKPIKVVRGAQGAAKAKKAVEEEAPESGPVRGAKKGKKEAEPVKPSSKVRKVSSEMPQFTPAPSSKPKVKTVRKAAETEDGVPVIDILGAEEV